jgi:hypothetical protein
VFSILADANGCAGFADGRAPNFVLLDWVDEGQAFQAGRQLNGLSLSVAGRAKGTTVTWIVMMLTFANCILVWLF